MQITLKLYATLSDYLPAEARRTNEWAMDVDGGVTLADLIARHQLPAGLVHLVLVNGRFVPPAGRAAHELQEGDVVAIWPPIAGG